MILIRSILEATRGTDFLDKVQNVYLATSWNDFSSRLESNPHNTIHNRIGGTMATFWSCKRLLYRHDLILNNPAQLSTPSFGCITPKSIEYSINGTIFVKFSPPKQVRSPPVKFHPLSDHFY
jgi:hypothetical protein